MPRSLPGPARLTQRPRPPGSTPPAPLAAPAPACTLAHVDTTTVVFRALSAAEIERYVAREQPFDCAGGFKAEALGIALFESIESRDPTALIGLPLIWLAGALRGAGYRLP